MCIRDSLTSAQRTLTAAVPHMVRAGNGGSIVITSSVAGVKVIPFEAHYVAAKHGLVGLMRALAMELADFGIRVNAIAPRGNTRMSSREIIAFTFDRPVEEFDPAFYENMRPEYVSPAVAFLAHESCPLTGEVLVCGDRMAKRLSVIETKGITFDEDPAPEELLAKIDQLMDPTDAEVMTINLWS